MVEERETGEAQGRPLRDVYSVTLGVALALAVERTIEVDTGGLSVDMGAGLALLAFVVTAFSLYHWAVRFVDVAYADTSPHGAAIVTSLLVGSVELVALLALSLFVSDSELFLVGLAGLLAFEAAAGVALWRSGAYGTLTTFGRKYLLINTAAVMAATGAAVLLEVADAPGALWGGAALLVACGRAVAFYKVGFRTLFKPGLRAT